MFLMGPPEPPVIYESNITHNLIHMAEAAGIDKPVWYPKESGIKTAADLIPHLERGIAWITNNPEEAKKFDAPNGWGTSTQFLSWLSRYLEACRASPEATIEVSR